MADDDEDYVCNEVHLGDFDEMRLRDLVIAIRQGRVADALTDLALLFDNQSDVIEQARFEPLRRAA